MYDVRGGKEEYSIPSQMLINRGNSTAEEWDGFWKKVEVIKKVKELFRNEINIIPDFEHDSSKESTLRNTGRTRRKENLHLFYGLL